MDFGKSPRLSWILACLTAVSINCASAFATTSEDYEKALAAYNTNEFDEAYIHLKNSLQKDPENLVAKILMGKILLTNGYLIAAELELIEALELGADINLVSEALGNTWLFLNKYQEIIDFQQSTKLTGEPRNHWLEIRATACIRMDDLPCAKKAYNDLLSISKGAVAAYNGLAGLAIRENQLAEAASLLSDAMASDPENAVTWRLRGQLAYEEGDRELAMEYLQTALSLNQEDPIALRNLVDLYLEAKDYERAKVFVDQVIADTPNDPLAILLSSWLESRESNSAIDNAQLQRLNEFMTELTPEIIASQPTLLYISGLTNFFNNNLEQASKDLVAYLREQPEDLQAVLLLSQTYLATQQDKQALLLLEKYQDALLEDLDAALILGDLLIRQQRAYKAEKLVEALEQRYPGAAKLQLFNIKLMAARGKREEALAILDNNFQKNKENPAFMFTYAVLKLQSGNYDDAKQAADILITIFQDKAEVYNLKAGILIKQNALIEAKQVLQKALDLEPMLFPAKFNLAATESRLGNISNSEALVDELLILSPQHMESMMLKAFNQARMGNINDAIALYKDILTLNPTAVSARERLSQLYLNQGDYKNALYHLDRLLKDDFDNPDYLMLKVDLLLRQNQSSDAIKTLNVVDNFVKDDPENLVRLSSLQMQIGDQNAALSSLERAHQLQPENQRLTLQLAQYQIATGRLEQADTIVKQLHKSGVNNANLWLTQGLLDAAKNNNRKAVDNYKKALKQDPFFIKPLIELYNYALQEQFVSDFITTSREIVENNPQNLLAKNLLAQYLFFIRDFEESTALYESLLTEQSVLNREVVLTRLALMAIEENLETARNYIDEAFSLAPGNPEVLDTYGWILAQQGNLEESLTRLREAYARDASNPNIRYHLGYTLAKLGRTSEAKKELEYAVNVKRPFFRRPQAEALLNSL
ncbi:XrtA/PEP-CTERM system TPR-repeat protein PrsT [Alteromonas sp. H39]|uniref:XrtA/PEP-CTERM system TPR-repeat protein PrsT n=1 Tax=Alteromonas sp. H39 TaxID=3389876 RepID=UPI0039E1CCCC